MQNYFRVLLKGSTATAGQQDVAPLSVDAAVKLQNEILRIYMSKEVQESLWNASDEPNDAIRETALLRLYRDIHKRVIKSYGFSPTDRGILQSQMAFSPQVYSNAKILEKGDLMEYLMDPRLQQGMADRGTKLPKGVSTNRGGSPNPATWDSEEPKVWQVVGGGDKGGIIVRQEGGTQLASRLATGATMEELEVQGDRMKYRKLTGDGPDFGWVTVELHGDTLARPYLEDGPLSARTFVVVHDRVAQRVEPSKTGELAGAVLRHDLLKGRVLIEDGIEWLVVKEKGEERFLMIDGASVGLGLLLKEVGSPRSFKVVNDRVAQRDAPSKHGQMVGLALKESVVKGTVVTDSGTDWLMVSEKEGKKFMLIHGESVGLGDLLEEIDALRTFRVVNNRVALRDAPSKAGKMLGAALKNYVFSGSVVKGDDTNWLMVKEEGETKYLMIDGSPVGLGILLEEVDPKAAGAAGPGAPESKRPSPAGGAQSSKADAPRKAEKAAAEPTRPAAAKTEVKPSKAPPATRQAPPRMPPPAADAAGSPQKLTPSPKAQQKPLTSMSVDEKLDFALAKLAAIEAKVDVLFAKR